MSRLILLFGFVAAVVCEDYNNCDYAFEGKLTWHPFFYDATSATGHVFTVWYPPIPSCEEVGLLAIVCEKHEPAPKLELSDLEYATVFRQGHQYDQEDVKITGIKFCKNTVTHSYAPPLKVSGLRTAVHSV